MTNDLVCSDLDGTLLDHRTYSFDAARPALALLKSRNIPLILATSKTAAEVAGLHEALNLGEVPSIVENGAGLYRPGVSHEDGDGYARIRKGLDGLPRDLRAAFRGFGDMDLAEIASLTGLPASDAELARQRRHSEPGLWSGTDAEKARFLDVLKAQGIHGRDGGRFLTLSLGRTKADGLAALRQEFAPDTVIALGDAPNDTDLLLAADIGVIVRNDHGPGIPPLPGEAEGRIIRTQLPGPAGWNKAVLDIVRHHDKET